MQSRSQLINDLINVHVYRALDPASGGSMSPSYIVSSSLDNPYHIGSKFIVKIGKLPRVCKNRDHHGEVNNC